MTNWLLLLKTIVYFSHIITYLKKNKHFYLPNTGLYVPLGHGDKSAVVLPGQ